MSGTETETNTEVTENPVVPNLEDMPYDEYAKFRRGEKVEASDETKDDTDTTQTSGGETDESKQDGGSKADADDDTQDTGGDSVDKSDEGKNEPDDSAKSGDLPRGIKRRLAREANKRKKAEEEAEELRAKLAALEKDDSQKETKSEESEEDKTDDFPDIDDYDSNEDWLVAVAKWETEQPENEFTDDELDKQNQDEGKSDDKSETGKTAPATQETKTDVYTHQGQSTVLVDIGEAIDESEEASDDLRIDFSDGIGSGAIHLTEAMAEWLAEQDDVDKVATIAQSFVDSPRKSRVIARKTQRLQIKMMQDLLNKDAPNEAPAKNIPHINKVTGSGATAPTKAPDDMSYDEYKIYRINQEKERRGMR